MNADELDPARLDLLVEGELADAERRALLESLDAAPDGWKRLATAFLEAQAWRAALADVAPLPTMAMPAPAAPRRRWAPIAAVAASLLAAFAGGWLLHAPQTPAVPQIAALAEGPTRRIGEIVWNGSMALMQAGVPAQRITVYENPDSGGAWLAALPPLVTSYSAGRLERMGCGVVERRDVVPVALADGRRLAVLVEDVQLRLKGRMPTT